MLHPRAAHQSYWETPTVLVLLHPPLVFFARILGCGREAPRAASLTAGSFGRVSFRAFFSVCAVASRPVFVMYSLGRDGV